MQLKKLTPEQKEQLIKCATNLTDWAKPKEAKNILFRGMAQILRLDITETELTELKDWFELSKQFYEFFDALEQYEQPE